MSSTTPIRKLARNRAGRAATPNIVVVDPAVTDYEPWLAEFNNKAGAQIQVFNRGLEALRHGHQQPVDLWVVNSSLPDMAGIDLCQMLKSSGKRAPIYLVSGAHSGDLERQAYVAGASAYGVTPTHRQWVDEWLSQRMRRF